MADLTREQKEDYRKFFVEKGDPGFNPTYNKMIVKRTIKKSEECRRRKHKDFIDKLGERSDAVATYFKSRMAEGTSPIEKYFSKRYLAHLRGQRILQKIQRLKNGHKIIQFEEI